MRKGIRNFCNGYGWTSTLNQERKQQLITPLTTYHHHEDHDHEAAAAAGDQRIKNKPLPPTTLEEMILQLEMEEEEEIIATKSNNINNNNNNNNCTHHDILRSARNAALNQYPRFSLDGRDALYRSSFSNFGRHSVCWDGSEIRRYNKKKKDHIHGYGGVQVKLGMPATLAGESVVWCNPGVIGKLMGLDAMPIPINNTKTKLINSVRINNRFQRHPKTDNNIERGRPSTCSSIDYNKKFLNINNNHFSATRRMPLFSSSSASNYRNRNSLKINRY